MRRCWLTGMALGLLLLSGAASNSYASKSLEITAGAKRARVLIVPIEGPIDRIQGAFLHRILAGAKHKYDAVIFDINTPGGRIDIMAKMSDDIVGLAPTPTIAFVSGRALSAGSFIAMSADRIYMAPRALIGAAKAYVAGPKGLPVELPKSIDEKLTSANRAQFRALADAKGYPPAIAQAMVDEPLEVKKVVFDGKEMYLSSKGLEELEADPLKKDKLKVLETVSRKGRLITFTAKEAVKYDIARGVVSDLDALLQLEEVNLADAERVRQAQNWSDKLIAVLTTPQLVGLLVLVGFGGVWLEMKMPGFGIPGTVGVIAFLLVLGSQFLVGNANALEILLFVIGIALLAIEIFVTPGFGFIGGGGVICVLVSLLLAMQSFALPQAPWEFRTLKFNLAATLCGVAGSFLVLLLATWVIPGTPIFNRLTLQKQLKSDEGYGSGVQEGPALVGKVGTVVSALRPAGKLEIGDRTFSVVSDAAFVGTGGKARVVRVDGPKIVVEPLEPEKPREPDFQA